MPFGAAAARLCGQAALLLGWRPAEFWAATPEELGCILSAHAPDRGESMDRRTLDKMMERESDG
ncbi:phage tail assembly chaperone [Novosphingobium sp. ZN18A2]|uniref:phage tail assembly chaperone n=1 Tax=Novosphingobium sp. ZN18A2 TaxID=3079861 RepID=UPI0030D49F2C